MASRRSAPRALRLASLAILFVASAAHAAPPASTPAAPTAAEKETARSLMTQGRERRDRGDLRGALEAFAGADAIMHVPTTGFELARTQIALGLLVEARETIGQLLRRPARPDDPKPFVDARANAATLDDDLVKRIPTLRIELRDAPAQPVPVSVDGVALPAEAAGEPLKVDPGHHVVVAGAEGATARAEVDVAERETKVATLTLPPQPAPDATRVAAEPAPASPPSEPPHHGHVLAITGFAIAGAGLAVGAVTGLMSISKTSSVKSSCVSNVCPPSSQGDLDSASTMATVSTVSFVVGGVGALVGIGALLFDHDAPTASEPAATSARVTPWIGLGAAGVRGTF